MNFSGSSELKKPALVDMYISPYVNKELSNQLMGTCNTPSAFDEYWQNKRKVNIENIVPSYISATTPSFVKRSHSPPVITPQIKHKPYNSRESQSRNVDLADSITDYPIDMTESVCPVPTMSANIVPKTRKSQDHRQVEILNKEVTNLRNENFKLQEKITLICKQLDMANSTLKCRDLELEASSANQRMALVEEIYSAQQIRDKAMLQRLELANKERDDAIAKLKDNEVHSDGYVSGNEEDNLNDIQTIIKNISSHNASPVKINLQGDKFINAFKMQQSKLQVDFEKELNAVKKERDDAIKTIEKLTIQCDANTKEHHVKRELKDSYDKIKMKLSLCQAELKDSIKSRKNTEEEMEKLRLYYNLHNSLAQEDHLRTNFNKKLGKVEVDIRHRDNEIQKLRKRNEKLEVEAKENKSQIQKINDTKIEMESRAKDYKNKEERLERTITVLRRKVNALSLGGTIR